jgi:hypothetical protein
MLGDADKPICSALAHIEFDCGFEFGSGDVGNADSLLALVFGDAGILSRLRLRQLREGTLLKCISALALRVVLLEQFAHAANHTGLDAISKLPKAVVVAVEVVQPIVQGRVRRRSPRRSPLGSCGHRSG